VSISDVAIRRPVFTAMMSTALIVLGLLGLDRLGTDLYPDVTFPFVTVTTVYPGASPQDIEESITRPVEDAVAGISGVDRVFSWSREDVSLVFVRFKLSVPLTEGVQNVRDKVGVAVGQLPIGSKAPVISQFDVSAQPVLVFSAAAGSDPIALRELLDDQVRPRLEQIDGVAAVRVLGGGEPEISVELFPERLRQLGQNPDAVFQKIKAEHLDLPGGRYPSGSREVGVRVKGEFGTADELRRMVVATGPDGSQVRLDDVALVRKGMKEPRTLVRTNGAEAVAIEVVKQAGANSAAVANAARKLLPELEKQFEFQSQVLIDQALTIEANAHEVWIAIFFGGAMAVLIILLFLLDPRGTFISALALPTSVIGTLFFMYVFGFSLNQLTLLGLSLAIGLLIDDAVVVRESITRRLERGDPPARAASEGTREIALAVMATTFTLVAVFVPVAFMKGITGQFFRQFGITISVAVLISLFVAFTLDPMLSARLARVHVPGELRREGRIPAALRRFFDATDRIYARSLDGVLRHRWLTLLAASLIFVASLGVGSRLGSEFVPAEDRNQLVVNLDFPPGTSLATTSAVSGRLEREVQRTPGVVAVYATLGPQEDVRLARWRVNLVDKSQRREKAEEMKQRIRRILASEPALTTSAVADPPTVEGLGDFPPIIMRVVGRDFDVLRREARFLVDTMKAMPALTDVQLKDSPGKPELQISVDRQEAARAGVPAGAVALQVRLATQGEVAGKVREGRREAEIRVRLAGEDRESPRALERLWIQTPRGPVSLSQLATLRQADGPATIEHEMRERQISVWAQMSPGHDLGSATKELRARLDQRKLPAGYFYVWDGMQKEQEDTQANMGFALLVAVLFIFMVLASQFESLVHPFTIMLALPLAIVGAFLGLFVTGGSINMGSLIGLILLMGLVTKNAILLVDGALQHMRDDGDEAAVAVRKAGPRRLRPIVMTSAAMVLGMLPTALGKGMGSEFRSPMAVAVIGGVITSTMLTLWVVPVVFVQVERIRARLRRRRRPPPGRPAPPPREARAEPEVVV
jgi:hydrophobe/amphiphile efflux-1 (HAE1) family protein